MCVCVCVYLTLSFSVVAFCLQNNSLGQESSQSLAHVTSSATNTSTRFILLDAAGLCVCVSVCLCVCVCVSVCLCLCLCLCDDPKLLDRQFVDATCCSTTCLPGCSLDRRRMGRFLMLCCHISPKRSFSSTTLTPRTQRLQNTFPSRIQRSLRVCCLTCVACAFVLLCMCMCMCLAIANTIAV